MDWGSKSARGPNPLWHRLHIKAYLETFKSLPAICAYNIYLLTQQASPTRSTLNQTGNRYHNHQWYWKAIWNAQNLRLPPSLFQRKKITFQHGKGKPWKHLARTKRNCVHITAMIIAYLILKSAVQYMEHFIYHFTSIFHGLIRTHKWPAPNVSGFIAQLVRASHWYREGTGSNPVGVLDPVIQSSIKLILD